MSTQESISHKPWTKAHPPKKIVIIRYQALGDIFATFPFISDLKQRYPNAAIDIIVRKDYADLPSKMQMFNKVYTVKETKSGWVMFISMMRLFPRLFRKRYDIVLDLQRNKQSRTLRRLISAKAWAEFDRFSPKSVMSRIKWSIEQLGLGVSDMDNTFAKTFPDNPAMHKLLMNNGWDGQSKLVLLNPAGAFVTRNWQNSRYSELIKKWLKEDPDTQFVMLGLPAIKQKAESIKENAEGHLIDLVGKTSISEAYAIVLKCSLVLTEDSGLGHFAWMSKVPTLMMFGSTRSDWTAPIGAHTSYFDSSNLDCGNCMRAECLHETIICMDQISVDDVYDRLRTLIK